MQEPLGLEYLSREQSVVGLIPPEAVQISVCIKTFSKKSHDALLKYFIHVYMYMFMYYSIYIQLTFTCIHVHVYTYMCIHKHTIYNHSTSHRSKPM